MLKLEDTKKNLKKAIINFKNIKFKPIFFDTLVRTSVQKEELHILKTDRIKSYLEKPRKIDYDDMYKMINNLLSSEFFDTF